MKSEEYTEKPLPLSVGDFEFTQGEKTKGASNSQKAKRQVDGKTETHIIKESGYYGYIKGVITRQYLGVDINHADLIAERLASAAGLHFTRRDKKDVEISPETHLVTSADGRMKLSSRFLSCTDQDVNLNSPN